MKKTLQTTALAALALAGAALPAVVAAQSAAAGTVRDAVAPAAMAGPTAGELASFVLSAVALVVAGIALSRTRRPL